MNDSAHTPALPMLPRQAWVLVIAGFAAMYLPIYWWAGHSIWQSDEQAHGALVLAVVAWLFWGLRGRIDRSRRQPVPALGVPLFILGLLVYLVGRVFSISILEFASQPLIVAGILFLLRGGQAIKAAWFALFYFIFMIPLPDILVDAVTGPLKQWISVIVVELLYHAGYPITRNGVVLTIGPYQLLVADACSGLHSMYSLSALGTLFMYLMRRKSVVHNAIMVASILPIAFLANIVRVIVLVLITYHLGDEAGQGFLHGTAGIVLMLVALVCFFALDSLLARFIRAPNEIASSAASQRREETTSGAARPAG